METATLRIFMCELLDEAGLRLRSAERYGVKLKMSRRMFMWSWRSDLRFSTRSVVRGTERNRNYILCQLT